MEAIGKSQRGSCLPNNIETSKAGKNIDAQCCFYHKQN